MSSHKKHFRSGNVPLAPAVPLGQTRRFGVKVVTKEGKAWYKKHTEDSYFSEFCFDRDSLTHEFPKILRQIRELGMEFIFTEPTECNFHKARSHYVTVFGQNVPITPTGDTCFAEGDYELFDTGLHYTNITRDQVYLVYALMTGTKLNMEPL
ncbi:hypothetical protein H5410_005637 [Solanum commersonii]|uniref:Uncharacterized protein n=1 Tax=Solanum commersonii TaxID=4109 RepID=A0A9J6A802_SOLCO|nr:hypothetical protein H5410_005637 [Solanum commersonii]